MARFLRTFNRIRLCSSNAFQHHQTGCVEPQIPISMDENKMSEANGEPPAKKPCIGETEEVKEKIRKRNVALLLAYNGSNYYGMQINHGFNTIESALVNALNKAGYIPAYALDNLHLIHFQRAARTDKGVSAAKQVVSFKIAENYDISQINTHLPDDIRVFGIKRVTKGFNSKGQCHGRTYSYTLPTYALAPEFHSVYPEDYRIQPETIARVNEELQKFVGTHSFHNFTCKKDGRDPSAKRYVLRFEAGQPFVNKEEFITLTIRGQSFMLHQIRKMVAHVIATMKGIVSEDLQSRIWNPLEKLAVPMAPGLGLVLEDVHYDTYNRKFGNDGMHHELTWDEVSEELSAFKRDFILSKILEKYLSEKVMFEWLQVLQTHTYDHRESEQPLDKDDMSETPSENANKEMEEGQNQCAV